MYNLIRAPINAVYSYLFGIGSFPRTEIREHPLYNYLLRTGQPWYRRLMAPWELFFLFNLALTALLVALYYVVRWQPILLFWPLTAIISWFQYSGLYRQLHESGMLRDLTIAGVDPILTLAAIRHSVANSRPELPFLLLPLILMNQLLHITDDKYVVVMFPFLLAALLCLPSSRTAHVFECDVVCFGSHTFPREYLLLQFLLLSPLFLLFTAIYYQACWLLIFLPIGMSISWWLRNGPPISTNFGKWNVFGTSESRRVLESYFLGMDRDASG